MSEERGLSPIQSLHKDLSRIVTGPNCTHITQQSRPDESFVAHFNYDGREFVLILQPTDLP